MKTTSINRFHAVVLMYLTFLPMVWAEVSIGDFTVQLPKPYILDTHEVDDGLNFNLVSSVTSDTSRTSLQLKYELTLTESGSGTVVGFAEKTVAYQVTTFVPLNVEEALRLIPTIWLDDQVSYTASLVVSSSSEVRGGAFEEVETATLDEIRVFDTTGALDSGGVSATLESLLSTPIYIEASANWNLTVGCDLS